MMNTPDRPGSSQPPALGQIAVLATIHFFILALGGAFGGLISGFGWYVGAVHLGLGPTLSGCLLFALYILIALAKLAEAGHQAAVTTGGTVEGSGAFEMFAALMAQLVGVSTLGLFGGLVGYIIYIFIMEFLFSFGGGLNSWGRHPKRSHNLPRRKRRT